MNELKNILTEDKNYFIYVITPQNYSDDEKKVNEELKNLNGNITWRYNNLAGAKIGDILIVKCGKDNRKCIKNNECEKLEPGIYIIGEIEEIDEKNEQITFKVIQNFYGNLPKDDEILKIINNSCAPRGRGLFKLKDNKRFLELLFENIKINILSNLLKKNYQLILQGPPGTGKTRFAKILALSLIGETIGASASNDKIKNLLKEHNDQIKLIQFHPSYSYEDFVRGIVVKGEGEKLKYVVEDKILAEIAKEALDNPDKNYILIIDEINRANLSSVLGELIYALEYRDEPVNSMYEKDSSREIILPKNLYIIGTMNTADRSIGHIDYAIRRRFVFESLYPNKNILNETSKNLFEKIEEIFDKYIAPEFNKDDVLIGHSYFITESSEDLKENLEYKIKPLLIEYVRDGILKPEAENIIKNLTI